MNELPSGNVCLESAFKTQFTSKVIICNNARGFQTFCAKAIRSFLAGLCRLTHLMKRVGRNVDVKHNCRTILKHLEFCAFTTFLYEEPKACLGLHIISQNMQFWGFFYFKGRSWSVGINHHFTDNKYISDQTVELWMGWHRENRGSQSQP